MTGSRPNHRLVLMIIVQDAVGEINAGAVMLGITQGNR